MEVLGRRPKAGIWCEETRRSWRAMIEALEVAMIEERLRNIEDKRTKVLDSTVCIRLERAPRRTLRKFRAMSYVMRDLRILYVLSVSKIRRLFVQSRNVHDEHHGQCDLRYAYSKIPK